MKKYILILLCSFILTSCSKSIFYEYYKDKGYGGTDYVTLEITPRNEIIYRGSTEGDSGSDIIYVYMYGKEEENPFNKEHFSLYPSEFRYIDYYNKFDICLESEEYWFSSDKNITGDLSFYFNERKDSIRIVNRKENIKNNPCFKQKKIGWLPKYLIKTDAIDYKKFINLKEIDEKYLKDPRKVPDKAKYYIH